jgi:hypothetical protein
MTVPRALLIGAVLIAIAIAGSAAVIGVGRQPLQVEITHPDPAAEREAERRRRIDSRY